MIDAGSASGAFYESMHFASYFQLRMKNRKGESVFSKVHSIGILGVEGYPVVVGGGLSEGLPGFTMVGYLSGAVREAQDRVRTALKNSGFRLPARKNYGQSVAGRCEERRDRI